MNVQFRCQSHDVVALLHPLYAHPPELVRIPSHPSLRHFAAPFSAKCVYNECLNLGVSPKFSKPPQQQEVIGSWFAQRILRTLQGASLSLTKRYEPIFIGLAVVKVSLRLASYQHIPPPS